jgi:hypothetical protein
MAPDTGTPSWVLFALPLVIATTIITGILFGGPAVGFLAAGIIASLIVIAAVRMKPRERTSGGPGAREGGSAEPAMGEAREGGWRAAAARRALVPLALAAGAVVVIAATDGTVRVIGWGLLAVAVAVALSLVFLEVGYSEDRARAREERRRGGGRSGR